MGALKAMAKMLNNFSDSNILGQIGHSWHSAAIVKVLKNFNETNILP